MRRVLGADVRRPVIGPDGLERGSHLLARIEIPQPDLLRPTLAKQLVGQTAIRILILRVLLQIHRLNEILAVEQPLDAEPAARLENLAAAPGELVVAHFPRHFLRGAQAAEIE